MASWNRFRQIWAVRFTIALMTLLMITASGQARPPAGPAQRATDEYAVYTASLEELYRGDGLLVIRTPTDIAHLQNATAQIGTNIPRLDAVTLDDFQVINQQEYPLSNRFDLHTTYMLVSQAQLQTVFGRNFEQGWKDFYKIYPSAQGIITLSRVGFNSELTQALVYLGATGDAESGSGTYIFLTKTNGAWTVQHQLGAWIT